MEANTQSLFSLRIESTIIVKQVMKVTVIIVARVKRVIIYLVLLKIHRDTALNLVYSVLLLYSLNQNVRIEAELAGNILQGKWKVVINSK